MKIWDSPRRIPGPFRCIAILWLTFLLAVIPTGLFFSLIDPLLIASCLALPIDNRLTVYTLGFLFFWLLGAGASFLTTCFLSGSDNGQAG